MQCTPPAARTMRRACARRWQHSASSHKSIAQLTPATLLLLLPRLECAAELVGERSECLRRCSIPAGGVLAHFCRLLRLQDDALLMCGFQRFAICLAMGNASSIGIGP